jgi:hypothetical protein
MYSTGRIPSNLGTLCLLSASGDLSIVLSRVHSLKPLPYEDFREFPDRIQM